MKKRIIIVFAFALAGTGAFYGFNHFSAANSPGESKTLEAGIALSDQRVDLPDLKGWPEPSKKAAKAMEQKYGKPHAVTSDMIIWNNNGPWLQTIVYKKEMKHDFPKPHTDVLEQWINYRVPLDKYNDIARYDGSVTCNRTNGTLSARCDNENMNFLALNLTEDIIKDKKDITQTRNDYGTHAMAFMNGEKPAYTQKLNFSSDKSAPDPDKPLDMMMKEKAVGSK